jgi:hypothetical protein
LCGPCARALLPAFVEALGRDELLAAALKAVAPRRRSLGPLDQIPGGLVTATLPVAGLPRARKSRGGKPPSAPAAGSA